MKASLPVPDAASNQCRRTTSPYKSPAMRVQQRVIRGCCGMHAPSCRQEEAFNIVSHGVGIPLALLLTSGLLDIAQSPSQGRMAILYGLCLLGLFSVSTMYHLVCWKFENDFANWYVQKGQLFDRSMIFLFIAASYTPFTAVMAHKEENDFSFSCLFYAVWAQAVFGLLYTIGPYFGTLPSWELPMYIMMGTSVFFCIRPLYADAPTGVIPCILGGGAAYLVGTYFYAAGRDGSIPYAHGIWHLFVIAGVCLVHIGVIIVFQDAVGLDDVAVPHRFKQSFKELKTDVQQLDHEFHTKVDLAVESAVHLKHDLDNAAADFQVNALHLKHDIDLATSNMRQEMHNAAADFQVNALHRARDLNLAATAMRQDMSLAMNNALATGEQVSLCLAERFAEHGSQCRAADLARCLAFNRTAMNNSSAVNRTEL